MEESLFAIPSDQISKEISDKWDNGETIELKNLLLQVPSSTVLEMGEERSVLRINEILVTHPFDDSFDYTKVFQYISACTTNRFKQKHILNPFHELLDFIHYNRGGNYSILSLPENVMDNLFFIFAYAYETALLGDGASMLALVVLAASLYGKSGFDGLDRYYSKRKACQEQLSLNEYPYWLDVIGKGNGREKTFVDEFIDKMDKYKPERPFPSYYNDDFIEIINYLLIMDKWGTLNKMFLELDMSDLLMACPNTSIYFTPEFRDKLMEQPSYNSAVLMKCISDIYVIHAMEQS